MPVEYACILQQHMSRSWHTSWSCTAYALYGAYSGLYLSPMSHIPGRGSQPKHCHEYLDESLDLCVRRITREDTKCITTVGLADSTSSKSLNCIKNMAQSSEYLPGNFVRNSSTIPLEAFKLQVTDQKNFRYFLPRKTAYTLELIRSILTHGQDFYDTL